ncbi:MAG: hypothetical protein LCI00_15570 [Chloroflexi bacterium]|nr:hypothetical protein [Chloroflexota bacterium]
METFKLRTHVGSDGVLKLDVPPEMINRDVDVVVVMQAVSEATVDALGWPVGFFDRTYGALVDDPLERPADLTWSTRDDVE